MATVLNICTRAAQNIGAIQSGEPLETQELTDIQNSLNALLDSESIQRDTIYRVGKPLVFNLVPASPDYSLGLNGLSPTLGNERPDFITSVSVVASGQGTTNEQWVQLVRLEEDDWQALPNRLLTSDLPTSYRVDPSYPAMVISLYPVPTITRKATVYIGESLARTVNTGDDLVFPRGYERFIVSNLALEIAPMFPGAVITPQLMKIADDSRQAVRNHNRPEPPRIFTAHSGRDAMSDYRVQSMRS